ncbi:CBS domain-containing protein [Citreicella sp. C3M06]|uniref:CBS domain-containing protein n=1 Tax=Citreicella sp. C3M06 TaxID=2841564 RepID=UPI001C08DBE7|nr:CBS domain-containing protein [Citreicella sp. C3M06]MBU2961310.1 CBS domain-containing protein [Citreicella sp. C3M06]
MTKRPRIADYMTRDLILLGPDLEILHAMKTLLEHRISGAPVVDAKERLIGVLSTKDCLRAALHGAYHQEWGGRVARYMTKDPVTLDADLDLVAAAERFLASEFRRFPVLRDGKLVGQVSRGDLLRALLEQW